MMTASYKSVACVMTCQALLNSRTIHVQSVVSWSKPSGRRRHKACHSRRSATLPRSEPTLSETPAQSSPHRRAEPQQRENGRMARHQGRGFLDGEFRRYGLLLPRHRPCFLGIGADERVEALHQQSLLPFAAAHGEAQPAYPARSEGMDKLDLAVIPRLHQRRPWLARIEAALNDVVER